MKRLLIFLLIVMMALNMTGCDDEPDSSGAAGSDLSHDSSAEDEKDSASSSGQDSADSGGQHSAGSSGQDSAGSGTTQGLFMQVDKATGKMLIRRPEQKASATMGQKGSWTIFVYLCGTDLESKLFVGGNATSDLKEMQAATSNTDVRFVIETGGTKFWHNSDVDEDLNQRFVIENGKLVKAEEKNEAGMGKSATLASFLKWGTKNYGAERMGVVLWNHGGGSIGGVCYDEKDDDDSLSLREIDAAFLSAYENMTDKFEFIGMDACLMGTLETANIAASYARYLYASEESEPGGGWDYTGIGSFLAANPNADGAQLGKIVCDSYYESCRKAEDAAIATLSVIDLSKMDTVVEQFNNFAKSMYEVSEDTKVLSAMTRKIVRAENFGGNNKADGYSNMVDLGGLLDACADYAAGSKEARAALKDAVVYSVNGSDHPKASGLALFYPLEVQSAEELSTFEKVCVSPYYLSYVDRKTQGFVSAGGEYEYDGDTWFSGGLWSWFTDYLFDDESGDYEYEEEDASDGYWSYLGDSEQTGDSPYITFEEEPQVDEDGVYYFVLDDEGYENTSDVIAYVYQMTDDERYLEFGETYDLEADWDEGYFADAFDGYWLSLPDGQNLATYIVDVTDDYVIYSSPILLNDEETNLRIRQTFDGRVTVEGAWEGISENGASARNIVKIGTGDTVVPMYYSYDRDDEESVFYGEEYDVSKKLTVEYSLLSEGEYCYSFCIDDIYGDYYETDPVVFYVDGNGEVSF